MGCVHAQSIGLLTGHKATLGSAMRAVDLSAMCAPSGLNDGSMLREWLDVSCNFFGRVAQLFGKQASPRFVVDEMNEAQMFQNDKN